MEPAAKSAALGARSAAAAQTAPSARVPRAGQVRAALPAALEPQAPRAVQRLPALACLVALQRRRSAPAWKELLLWLRDRR
jgi:hypothetical protein